MFEDCFVTCLVAIALRAAGFDEPCMAVWESNGNYEDHNRILHIKYDSSALDPAIYNDDIRKIMESRPGLFTPKLKNSEISPWLYAAPLYDQVIQWFLSKGLYLHPYRVPGIGELEPYWGVNIFNMEGNNLWPEISIQDEFHGKTKRYHHNERRDAIEQAILAALKLLKNE